MFYQNENCKEIDCEETLPMSTTNPHHDRQNISTSDYEVYATSSINYAAYPRYSEVKLIESS